MKKKLFLLTLYLFFFYGCGKKKEKVANTDIPIEKKALVKITKVKIGKIEETVSLVGDIYGWREVKVYTKVNGRLAKKMKDEGEMVKENEVVALVNRDEPALKYTEAEIKSPIDGIITKYFADIGDDVFPAQPMPREPVFTIADINKVKLEAHLSEKDIAKVAKGQKVRIFVDAFPEKIFWGEISEIAPTINPLTRKLKLGIEVANKEFYLKPGMFGRAEIIVREYDNILTVPLKAVLDRGKQKIVLTVRENKAKMLPVETGINDEENMEIKRGLTVGERVIVEGNYGLLEGTEVEVIK
jgi:multidrug efflux pump subunit AcrA (membrane-fusion protein)